MLSVRINPLRNLAMSIHPFPLNPTQGWGELDVRGRVHRDKRDRQPCTLSPRGNLETQINQTCMFLGGGRKPEYRERTHTYTGRTCRLRHRKSPGSLLQALVQTITTLQPIVAICHFIFKVKSKKMAGAKIVHREITFF